MRLTKKLAIAKTIEMWEELAETGSERKHETKAAREWEGDLASDCFLCEYNDRHGGDDPINCSHCPYDRAFGRCSIDDMPFGKWADAETLEERKKYAKLFLEEVKTL